MYTRLVVPLDGSELAELALAPAGELARLSSAPLHLVRVVDVPSPTRADAYGLSFENVWPAPVFEEEQTVADRYLAEIRQTFADRGIEVTTELGRGNAVQQLLMVTQPGDLLVMASHGRSGVGRWFLGSVAENVVRRSPVPVLLVPSGDAAVADSRALHYVEPQPDQRRADATDVHRPYGPEQSQEHDRLPVGLGLGIGSLKVTSGVLGEFTLADEIAQFTAGTSPSGRRAETLVKTDQMRVVLETMKEGVTLHQHTAPGPITIQPLRGRFAVTVNDEEHEVATGGLIAIAPDTLHGVRALEDGAFLLTIGWPPKDPGVPNPGGDR